MILDDQGKLILHPKTCSDECKKRLLGPSDVYCASIVGMCFTAETIVEMSTDGRFAIVTYWGSGAGDYFCKHVYGAPSILFAECAVCCGGMSNVDHLIKTGQVACKTFAKRDMPCQFVEEIQKSYMPWLVTRELFSPIDCGMMSDNDIREFVAQTCIKSRRQHEQQQRVSSSTLGKRRRKHQCITTTNMWNIDLISAVDHVILLSSGDE